VQHAEWSDTDGVIKFGWGQCTLRATSEGLMLRAEAADEHNLRRIQDGIAARLERIGRRDQLTVNWQQSAPSTAAPGQVTSAPAARTGAGAAFRGRLGTIGLTAAVALAVAVHLGLGGALLAHARWTSWVTNVIVALVVVKALFIGRFALRRSKTSKRHGTLD
jgi:hypothetical protein